MGNREDKWMCLMVDGNFRRGDKEAAEKELASVFGGDFVESRSVCSDDMISSTGEYYVFVRCRSYEGHADRMRGSAAVVSVVPSYENPHLFSEAELKEFEGSVSRQRERTRELRRGDMVLVKEGYLKNLYGVVSGRSDGRYRVRFSFYMRVFSEVISEKALGFVGNVLGVARRSASGSGGGAHLVSGDKLRGKKGGDAGVRQGG